MSDEFLTNYMSTLADTHEQQRAAQETRLLAAREEFLRGQAAALRAFEVLQQADRDALARQHGHERWAAQNTNPLRLQLSELAERVSDRVYALETAQKRTDEHHDCKLARVQVMTAGRGQRDSLRAALSIPLDDDLMREMISEATTFLSESGDSHSSRPRARVPRLRQSLH